MSFGNSKGGNKGKKYLDRKNLDFDRLTADDYSRLDDFNTWYVDNIDSVKQSLISKNSFNDDVMGDTYAEICETLLFSGTVINDYMGYFSRAYYTNHTRYKMASRKYVGEYADTLPNRPLNDVEVSDSVFHPSEELLSNVMQYVKRNYPMGEHFLFYQYVNLENRNYQSLSLKTGRTVYEIQKVISKIKRDIQSNINLIV